MGDSEATFRLSTRTGQETFKGWGCASNLISQCLEVTPSERGEEKVEILDVQADEFGGGYSDAGLYGLPQGVV
jgi:hypothetical protein